MLRDGELERLTATTRWSRSSSRRGKLTEERPRRTRSARSSPARSARRPTSRSTSTSTRRARRRRLPAVQRRPDVDGPRGRASKEILEARRLARAGRPRADRRRQRRRRARQHHRRPVPARGRRAAARRRASPARPPSTTRRGRGRTEPRQGVARPRSRTASDEPAAPSTARDAAPDGPVARVQPSRAAPSEPPRAPRRRRDAAPRAAPAPRSPARADRRRDRCWRSSLGGLWTRHARRLLRRHRRRRASSRSTAACRTSCRSASSSTSATTRSGVRLEQVPAARRAHVHRPQAALAATTPTTSCSQLETGPARVSARNRELLGAGPGVAARDGRLRRGLHPGADVVSRRVADLRRDLPRPVPRRRTSYPAFTLPDADPYLFPLVAVLACFGLVVIYRIDEELAREQAQWFVVGLALFAATILLLRDYRVLERYRYTIAAVGLLLLLLPRVPGIGAAGQRRLPRRRASGRSPSSRRSSPRSRSSSSSPSYLRDTRQVLVAGLAPLPRGHDPAAQAPRAAARRLGRGDGHAGLHPRPRLVADVLRRLPGAALRGDEPALVRARRARAVRARRVVLRATPSAHVQDRVDVWLRPVRPGAVRAARAAATRSPSRCSRRPTAGCSARLRRGAARRRPAATPIAARRRTPT